MAEGLDLLEPGDAGLYFDEPCLPEVERDVLGAAPLLAVIAQQLAQHEEDVEHEVAR